MDLSGRAAPPSLLRLLWLGLMLLPWLVSAQSPRAFYVGNSGREVLYDLTRLSDGTFVIAGTAEDLDWVDGSVPRIQLPVSGILNPSGTGRTAFLLQVSSDLGTLLKVVHLPDGAAEDFRFIKQNVEPNATTDALFVSGNTTEGYFLGKLNDDFIAAAPTAFAWVNNVEATGYVKENHPWDVGSDGKVAYIVGESHGYDWAAMHRLDANGVREVVEHWRVHWKAMGGEWYGDPASSAPDPLGYSGVVLKRGGRCDLRSWTQADYEYTQADGNGGTKRGRWPLDFMYDAPCDPNSTNTSNGPGYNGYSPAGTPIYGPQVVTIDRRDNSIYLGLNVKTVLPGGEPDFEPAVVKFNSDGSLGWWSRLYHEIQPDGDTVTSSPDQYIDGIAIDYSQPLGQSDVVVNARCHGNNVENFWEGNTIAATPGASGFQNRFTGSQGNIHISWLGKLAVSDGTLKRSTYVAEYVEGANNYGAPLADPNLASWPDPNAGWPDVNTTRLARCAVKATADGSVAIIAVGRRTITTANAYQQMPLPSTGLTGTWNSFVRVYEPDLSQPKYSSLVVGDWDTGDGSGGGNTDLYGQWKTGQGVIAVGRHQEEGSTGLAKGDPIPVSNVPAWGQASPENESGLIVFYPAAELVDPDDDPPGISTAVAPATGSSASVISPNPASDRFTVRSTNTDLVTASMLDHAGRTISTMTMRSGGTQFERGSVASGTYLLVGRTRQGLAISLGKVVLQ